MDRAVGQDLYSFVNNETDVSSTNRLRLAPRGDHLHYPKQTGLEWRPGVGRDHNAESMGKSRTKEAALEPLGDEVMQKA